MRVERILGDRMNYWKCVVCGYIYQFRSIPELCLVCNAGKNKLKRINSNLFMKTEDFEIPKRKKKKYRRIFKKGFRRKYKKL